MTKEETVLEVRTDDPNWIYNVVAISDEEIPPRLLFSGDSNIAFVSSNITYKVTRTPRNPPQLKVSVEELSHMSCSKCQKWWTIGYADKSRLRWYCPWCGTANNVGERK